LLICSVFRRQAFQAYLFGGNVTGAPETPATWPYDRYAAASTSDATCSVRLQLDAHVDDRNEILLRKLVQDRPRIVTVDTAKHDVAPAEFAAHGVITDVPRDTFDHHLRWKSFAMPASHRRFLHALSRIVDGGANNARHVRELDDVVVDHQDSTYSQTSQLLHCKGTGSTGSNDADDQLGESQLALLAEDANLSIECLADLLFDFDLCVVGRPVAHHAT